MINGNNTHNQEHAYDIERATPMSRNPITQAGQPHQEVCFIGHVQRVVEEMQDQVYATWWDSNGKETKSYTFSELWQEAGVVAYYLRHTLELNKGDHVVLCYNFGLHFFASFLGCIRAGVVAVLVYPPTPPLTKSLPKMAAVVKNCQARVILCDADVMFLHDSDMLNPLSKSRHLWPDAGTVQFKSTTGLYTKRGARKGNNNLVAGVLGRVRPTQKSDHHRSFDESALQETDVAFLQYTSGSTGSPKGVEVTLGNLASNVQLLLEGVTLLHQQDPTKPTIPERIIGFSWLPQYHDMGLVYGTIVPFIGGWREHYISPTNFIKKPLLWIELMSRCKVNMGVAPDFAYRLVARKFVEAMKNTGDGEPIPNLDLSNIRFLSNAAEPVRPDTHELFGNLFEKYGLRREYNAIGYGLAEHVVTICWFHGYRPATKRAVGPDGAALGAVGSRNTFHPSVTIKIVDPTTLIECQDGEEGEVWVSSPSVAQGYFGKSDLSKEVFQANISSSSEQQTTFLRTGDLGFFEDDHLFICGRIKDVIIINGTNYYPQDVEAAVMDASEAVRQGCVAAFSKNEEGGDGETEIVFEIRKDWEKQAESVCRDIRSTVLTKVGLVPTRIVAIKERTICKTTSGKIQRKATRKKLHEGDFQIVHDWTSATEPPPRPETDEDLSSVDLEAPAVVLGFDQRFQRVVSDVLGNDLNDMDATWEDLGLSSMASVQLQNAIADEFSVSLEPDAFELYQTPSVLAVHVATLQGEPLPVKLTELTKTDSMLLSWPIMGILQAIGIVFHIFLFTVPIIPAYHLINLPTRGIWVRMLWGPVVVPMWMSFFTAMVIAAKWIVVGRYTSQSVPVNSIAYLRWWWMDRAIHVWEFWVGAYFQKTVFLWATYQLMGANIHISAKLGGFIREFDLVEISEGATLDHRVRCRKFGPWKDSTSFPELRFRPVTVAKGAVIRGMISPGASVGEQALVDHRSVVPECAQVPKKRRVCGTRMAVNHDEPGEMDPKQSSWAALGFAKFVWLVFELYLFFWLIAADHDLVCDNLPNDWHYRGLFKWVLLFALAVTFHLFLGVPLKWLFIGRRVAGPTKKTFWAEFADWAVDYHFYVSASFFMALFSNSVLWNVLLKMYGMDIDMKSKVTATSFPPSKVDLIRVQNSFISQASFDTEKEGINHRTEVIASSIGYNVVVGPGVELLNTVVAPVSHVTQSVQRVAVDHRFKESMEKKFSDRFKHHIVTHLLYGALLGLLLVSLLPAYEFWMSSLEPRNVNVAVLVLAVGIVMTSIALLLVLGIFQALTYPKPSAERTSPWNLPSLLVYISVCWSAQTWSFLPLLWGTPFFGPMIRLFGATVQGRFLYFGDQLFDFPLLTVSDLTVMDGVMVNGHHTVYEETTIGPDQVSGLLHEGTLCFANSRTTTEESGPWRAVF